LRGQPPFDPNIESISSVPVPRGAVPVPIQTATQRRQIGFRAAKYYVIRVNKSLPFLGKKRHFFVKKTRFMAISAAFSFIANYMQLLMLRISYNSFERRSP
jgi:hypothetical protein